MADSKRTVRIGCGSPDAEARLGPGIDLARDGGLDYLCLDTLSERTLPQAQLRRHSDPKTGFDRRATEMFTAMLDVCLENEVRVVGNMGGANPEGAFDLAIELLRSRGHAGTRVALITGDDVLGTLRRLDPILVATGQPLSLLEGEIVSANAYIGADPIIAALERGADLVIGGRIADPSLYLGPLMYEFGWSDNDWDHLAAGQTVGHLLECGHHATGGNMADPPYRPIPGLTKLGYPMGEVEPTGDWVMSKLPASGGVVDVLNCKAQLFHEIHDPAQYLTPDVTVDLTDVTFRQVGEDRVAVTGAHGSPRPESLKVLVGVMEGFIGEGELTFAGPGALSRADLAAELVRERIAEDEPPLDELRVDLIGINSVFGEAAPPTWTEPPEVRLRVAARTRDRGAAEWVSQEVHSLFFGPASGGGIRRGVHEVLGMHTTHIPREELSLEVHCEEVSA
jgi:Acyclic terpene utilisation family protein AtuA